jgi:arylsulfatase A-like enzyme
MDPMDDSRHRVVATALCVLAPLIGCGVLDSPDPPPNILLISIDALRADHLGCYGYGRATSPFLDDRAAAGIRYANAFVNTHGTPPSHTTMLSSLYQESHRVGIADTEDGEPGLKVPDAVELVQEVLLRNGWATVGVTGGGFMEERFGFARGFESFTDRARNVEQGTAMLVEAAALAIQSGRPVFGFYHTYQVHTPYLPPEGYRGLFGEDDCAVEPVAEALAPIQATAFEHLTQDAFDCLAALYDAEIRYTDDTLRSLFDRLASIGFLDHAVVIVTADHGEEFGDHGGLLHRGSLFDELLHVPLIVWGTGVPRGIVAANLVSTLDLAPTILALAELPPTPIMAGSDLLSLPAPDPSTERVFAQYGSQLYGIRTHRWKLIVGGGWANPMLFDLEVDPHEMINVAKRHPDVSGELLAELTAWRKRQPRLELAQEPVGELPEQTEQQLRELGYIQ